MRRMEKVTGRSDDMIILRGVNVFPTQIEEQILKCAGLAPHFQIELTRTGRMDDMVVHVEATAQAADATARAASAKELAHHIKSVVGVSTKIEVHDPERRPALRGQGEACGGQPSKAMNDRETDNELCEGVARPSLTRRSARGRRDEMARTRASDFEEKQHSILKSAAAVLAEQGMDKASMAQIASHCQVSKALLYHYYPSKDELIFAIIHTHLVELEASLAAATDEELAPEEQLRVLVGVVLQQYRGADDAHKVQLVGIAALSDEQRAEIRAIERQIVRHFSKVLRKINPDSTAPSVRCSCPSPCRSSG